MWPENLTEWTEYISSLSGEELSDKANACNSLKFVKILQEEGYDPDDIGEIFLMFAQALDADPDTYVSNGANSYLSYQRVLERHRNPDRSIS